MVSNVKSIINKPKAATREVESKAKKIPVIDFLKAYHSNGQKVDSKLLSKFGLKEEKRIDISENLFFTRDFLGNYSCNLKDSSDDVFGSPIKENSKLIAKVLKLWSADKRKITVEELMEVGIFTNESSFKVGENIMLSSFLGFKNYFSIDVDNDEKDLEGKWIDEYVTVDKVRDALIKFDYNKKRLTLKEVPLNKELEIYLKEHFCTVKKSGMSAQGEHDLIIGSGKHTVAIELKLSREIKDSGKHHTAIGQIDTYSKAFNSNLLVVVAGIRSEQQEFYVKKVIEKAKEVRAKWMFLEPD